MKISHSTMAPSTFFTRLLVGTVVINLFIIILTVLSLLQSRLQYERQAEVTTQNLVGVLEANIDNSLDKIDVVLAAMADAIEKDFSGEGINAREVNALIARQAVRLPEVDGLRMADAHGRIIYGTGLAKTGKGVDIADREYFERLRQDRAAGLVISKVLVSRVIGKSVVVLARRVNRPDHSFAGVIYGVISLEHFRELFSSVDIGPNGAIALRDEQLRLVTRLPELPPAKTLGGKKVAGSAPDSVKGRKIGTYKAESPTDNVERMYTFKKFSHYPLYISVGLATDDYLSAWDYEAARMSALTALFVVITLFGSWRVWHDWKRNNANIQALTEKEKKYRTLFEESKDTILISDATGRILDVNKAGIDLLGYTKEELVALDPAMLYCNVEDRERMWQKLLISGYVEDFQVEMQKKEGKKITVELSVVVIRDEEGNVCGHRGIAHDVTDRKRLEQQLFQAQKMESIGLLAGGVAHDFNNLLTAISGYAETIQEVVPAEDEVLQDCVEQVLKASDRGAELARDLLAFSRKQVIHPKPLHVNSIIRSTSKLIKRIIGEDIRFSTALSDADMVVMADTGQIEQVLMNLTTNARDAMPNGGHLRIITQEVVVAEGDEAQYDLAKPGKYAKISVCDDGSGIEKDDLARIFEPFFTTKEVGKGTGLGLAMIFGVLKQHHGSVLVESEMGKGTVFDLYIPVVEECHPVKAKQRPAAVRLFYGHETILVAEDEEMVGMLMKKIFERVGYKVILAVDGEDAVKKFTENKDEISLVLSDVIMPGKNGRQILEEVRKIRPEIKVLFISGYTANVMHEKGIFEEGMEYIQKPFVKEKLLQKVREVLDKEYREPVSAGQELH